MQISIGTILLVCGQGPSANRAIALACQFGVKYGAKIDAHFIGITSGDSSELQFLNDYAQSKQISLSVATYRDSNWNILTESANPDVYIVSDMDEHLEAKNSIVHTKQVIAYFKYKPLFYIRKSEVPILGDILVPLTSTPNSKVKVSYVGGLALDFRSNIHLLPVSNKKRGWRLGKLQTYLRQTERYLVELGVKYTVKSKLGSSISEGILAYAKEIDAGLVAHSRRSKSYIFSVPNWEKLLQSSDKSLLLIPKEK